MSRILLNEKQRNRRRAQRFVDLNYVQQRTRQNVQQLNKPPTEIGEYVTSFSHQLNTDSFEAVFANSVDVQTETLSYSPEDRFEVLPSDTSDDEESNFPAFDLRKALAEWAINTKTPAYHVDELLSILRNIAPSLPKCCKTLCKTPRIANITEMDNGHYLDIGLQECLNRFLSKNNFTGECLTIDVNVDGVNTSNSSSSDIWPILVSVVGYKDILMPGAFHGTEKPRDVNNFLKRFVDEFNKLSGGFCNGDKVHNLHIRAVVADVPAKTYILDSTGHAGYSSCTKCTIKGERIENTMCFPGFDFKPRTNGSVRNRDDEHHHHSMEPITLEELPIDLVNDVIVDNMHCTYLGIQKLLLKLWVIDRREHYSMSPQNVRNLSADIQYISHQLPSEFSRFPRPLNYLKRYKATENRQLLLYTLPILLDGKMRKV